jgi:hypothetical protein
MLKREKEQLYFTGLHTCMLPGNEFRLLFIFAMVPRQLETRRRRRARGGWVKRR